MISTAEHGYSQTARQTANPRTIEQRVLMSIASDIEAPDPSTPQGYKQLAIALRRNTELWTAFASDIANPENTCTPELKAEIIKLADFSIRHGILVLRGEADRSVLVNINRTVAGGLSAAAQAA